MISVLLAVYNAEDYLTDALDSLASQTYTDFEIVAIDDGSTDSTPRILSRYASRPDLNMVVHRQDNQGLTVSLNRAFQMSRGDYIARMDADDVSLPRRFELSLAYLKNRDLDFVVSRAQQIRGDTLGNIVPRVPNIGEKLFSPTLLKFGNMFVHGTFFMRRQVMELYLYDEAYRTAQDYDFLLRISRDDTVRKGYIPEVLYLLRVNSNSLGRNKRSSQIDNARRIACAQCGTSCYLIPGSSTITRLLKSFMKHLFIWWYRYGSNR